MLDGDLEPSFTVTAALKDAGLITAGESCGATVAGAQAVEDQYRRAAELGHAEHDLAAVFHAARASQARTAAAALDSR